MGAPFNGVNPFPFPPPGNIAQLRKYLSPPPCSTTILGLPWKTPVNQEWSFSIQQALGVNASLEVAYIGSAVADAIHFSRRKLPPFIPLRQPRGTFKAGASTP